MIQACAKSHARPLGDGVASPHFTRRTIASVLELKKNTASTTTAARATGLLKAEC